MRQSLRDHAPHLVAGAGFMGYGAAKLVAGETATVVGFVSAALFLIAGISMLHSAVYETRRANSDRAGRRSIEDWITIGSGAILLIAALLTFAGS